MGRRSERNRARCNPAPFCLSGSGDGGLRSGEISNTGWCELFWRSHILHQLANVGRAQGILTIAVDALIFATRHSLREQKLQGLVALRTDRVFALRHLYRQGSKALSVSNNPSLFPKPQSVKRQLIDFIVYFTNLAVYGYSMEPMSAE